MSKSPARYPLAWPKNRPRRRWQDRITGSFSKTVAGKSKKVDLATACDRLELEIERLGGVYPILSSNVELRMDGRPKGGVQPSDPAVCVYFSIKGDPYAMACDTFTEVAQNIAALANHIEALRRIERYGVQKATEMLRDFQALPAPDAIALPSTPPWHEVLGVHPTATEAQINAAYRNLAKGGTDLLKLNLARDAALKELK